jgi:hypothetical protein
LLCTSYYTWFVYDLIYDISYELNSELVFIKIILF